MGPLVAGLTQWHLCAPISSLLVLSYLTDRRDKLIVLNSVLFKLFFFNWFGNWCERLLLEYVFLTRPFRVRLADWRAKCPGPLAATIQKNIELEWNLFLGVRLLLVGLCLVVGCVVFGSCVWCVFPSFHCTSLHWSGCCNKFVGKIVSWLSRLRDERRGPKKLCWSVVVLCWFVLVCAGLCWLVLVCAGLLCLSCLSCLLCLLFVVRCFSSCFLSGYS